MHFYNVYHSALTLYKKIFNLFKLFIDCTSVFCCLCHSFVMPPIPISLCDELLSEPDDNKALFVPMLNCYFRPIYEAKFYLNFSISYCTDSADSFDMFI